MSSALGDGGGGCAGEGRGRGGRRGDLIFYHSFHALVQHGD